MFVELPRIINHGDVTAAQADQKSLPPFDTEPFLIALDTISKVRPAPHSYPYTYVYNRSERDGIPVAMTYAEVRERIEKATRN